MSATVTVPKWVSDAGVALGVGDLWQPEAVMPAQFYARKSGASPWLIEMLTALLNDAFKCAAGRSVGTPYMRRNEQRDALAWFESCEYDSPVAFESVAQALGLNADAVRRQLPRLVEEGTTGRLRGNVKYVRKQAHEYA